MPGDRRQILSLLRLPVPPLQLIESTGVTTKPRRSGRDCHEYCNVSQHLWGLGETLHSLLIISVQAFKCTLQSLRGWAATWAVPRFAWTMPYHFSAGRRRLLTVPCCAVSGFCLHDFQPALFEKPCHNRGGKWPIRGSQLKPVGLLWN